MVGPVGQLVIDLLKYSKFSKIKFGPFLPFWRQNFDKMVTYSAWSPNRGSRWGRERPWWGPSLSSSFSLSQSHCCTMEDDDGLPATSVLTATFPTICCDDSSCRMDLVYTDHRVIEKLKRPDNWWPVSFVGAFLSMIAHCNTMLPNHHNVSDTSTSDTMNGILDFS